MTSGNVTMKQLGVPVFLVAAIVAGVGAMRPPAAADEEPSFDTQCLQRQIDEAAAMTFRERR